MDRVLAIIFLFYIPLCFSSDVSGIPLQECQSRHPENWTTYQCCGYELGTNYSKQAIYLLKIEGGPPTLSSDCNSQPSAKPPELHKFCVKSDKTYYRAQFNRGCDDITYCTRKQNYCGFKNIEEVKQEIVSSTPAKGRQRQGFFNFLEDHIKKEKNESKKS